jgi:hypothetical protein
MWVRFSFTISNTLIPSPHVYKCNFSTIIYNCKLFRSQKNFTFQILQIIEKRVSFLTLRLKTKAQFLSELCFLMPHNLNYHLKMGK